MRCVECAFFLMFFNAGFTPLITAAMSDHISVVKYLLDRGADPMKSDENGSTALHHAAATGWFSVTQMHTPLIPCITNTPFVTFL